MDRLFGYLCSSIVTVSVIVLMKTIVVPLWIMVWIIATKIIQLAKEHCLSPYIISVH